MHWQNTSNKGKLGSPRIRRYRVSPIPRYFSPASALCCTLVFTLNFLLVKTTPQQQINAHVERVNQSPRRNTRERATRKGHKRRVDREPRRCRALLARWPSPHQMPHAVIFQEIQRCTRGIPHYTITKPKIHTISPVDIPKCNRNPVYKPKTPPALNISRTAWSVEGGFVSCVPFAEAMEYSNCRRTYYRCVSG